MRLLRIEVVIASAALVLFVLLGWSNYEMRRRAVETVESYSSYDFQRGGYHAWFDLLRREGIHVARYERRPAYLNDSVATLIVATNDFDTQLRAKEQLPTGQYATSDLVKLHDWVVAGGRLVWLVDQATATDDETKQRLRKLFGLHSHGSLRLPLVSQSGTSSDAAIPIVPSPLTDGVATLSGTSGLRIPFDADPEMTPLFADDRGSVVAWYALGRGSVVIVTDETLFENGRIAKADNARLAYNLAAFGLAPGDMVAFEEWTHGYQTGDTWWSVTPWPMRLGLSVIFSALALALLGAVWRFGPAAKLPDNTERTSEEYVTSMAMLLDRGRAARKAIHDLGQIALHAAARSVGLPDSAPASLIATRLRGSEAGDRRAHDLITLERLTGYEHPSPAELIQAAQLSHTLRKDLSLDGFQHIQPRRSAARRSA